MLDSRRWFLAQVRANCWRMAERNLRRQAFETFNPRMPQTRRSAGRFQTAHRPVFPGYIFVRFDPRAGHWQAINSTYGVSRLVRFGGHPAPVPDGLVEEMVARCAPETQVLVNPGDPVRVLSGPFADFVGQVEHIAPDRRVCILINLMGQAAKVQLDPHSVAIAPN